MSPWRKSATTFHVIVASFFLPVGLMFAVTGALYTVSIKGGYRTTKAEITVVEPLGPELATLVAAAQAELDARNLAPPTGSAGVKKMGASYQLEWTGANRDVILTPSAADPRVATLEVKDTSPYRRLVQLHKAKGSAVGRAISVLWGLGLVALFASGAAMALGSTPHRRLALATMGAGLATFIAYAFIG